MHSQQSSRVGGRYQPLPRRCTRTPAPARTELSFPRASGERRHGRRHRT